MWNKIRDYIWEQYTDQPPDTHALAFRIMAREILSKTSMLMARLGYDRHVTPLLTVRMEQYGLLRQHSDPCRSCQFAEGCP